MEDWCSAISYIASNEFCTVLGHNTSTRVSKKRVKVYFEKSPSPIVKSVEIWTEWNKGSTNNHLRGGGRGAKRRKKLGMKYPWNTLHNSTDYTVKCRSYKWYCPLNLVSPSSCWYHCHNTLFYRPRLMHALLALQKTWLIPVMLPYGDTPSIWNVTLAICNLLPTFP